MGDGRPNWTIKWHRVQSFYNDTDCSGSLFFTGPVLLLFASFAEWIVGNFFAFIVSYFPLLIHLT